MTVAELIAELQKLPPQLEVHFTSRLERSAWQNGKIAVQDDRDGEGPYVMVHDEFDCD